MSKFSPHDFREALPLEPWRERLLAAAERVERGWCQGTEADENGGVCALGAIFGSRYGEQAPFPPGAFEADAKLRQFLIGGRIGDWNDKLGQTAANVAATMRLVALS